MVVASGAPSASSPSSSSKRPAVLVGLCAHGLDIVHSLDRAGVPVVAIESDPTQCGLHTSRARVVKVADVNGPGLIEALVRLAKDSAFPEKPVLLLTNDNMVFLVADRWAELEPHYLVSWSGCRERAREFLLKSGLESYCERVGIRYPRSRNLHSAAEVDGLEPAMELPWIVKPVRPQSGFKVELVDSAGALKDRAERHAKDLPFVVQQYIPGTVERIVFCAVYFREGVPVAHFEGRKLSTLPMGMGTTTMAEPISNEELYRETLRFFEPLKLTGPVSLEFKQDPQGRLWVIEPTMFRTDYWFGVCSANGVNLVLAEYLDRSGSGVPAMPQRNRRIWVEWERDPLCVLRLLRDPLRFLKAPRGLAFTFLSLSDPKPAVFMFARTAKRLAAAIASRVPGLRRA